MYPIYYNSSSKEKEASSASNRLAEHHEISKLSAVLDEPNNEQPANSISKDPYEEEVTPFGYSVVDVKDVSKCIIIIIMLLLHYSVISIHCYA